MGRDRSMTPGDPCVITHAIARARSVKTPMGTSASMRENTRSWKSNPVEDRSIDRSIDREDKGAMDGWMDGAE